MPAAPVAFGAVFRARGAIALQYWLFHAFDLWSPFVPQSADCWKLHEGDWEADFGPGRYLQEEQRCWPQAALAAFDAYKVAVADHAAAGTSVAPRVLPMTAASPGWMRFPGTFGERQYLHFPQAGPRGPAFHELWKRPFAEPRRWRPG